MSDPDTVTYNGDETEQESVNQLPNQTPESL